MTDDPHTPGPAPDPLARLAAAVDAIREKLDRDEFHAGLVARLSDELEGHRRGQADRLLLPLVAGIIRLHTNVTRQIEAARREPAEKVTPDRLARAVAGFKEDLELLLDDAGVVLYAEPGDGFNPHRQVAVRPEPTPDPGLAGKVAARVRPGFEFSGRVVEKERVVVYTPPQPQPPAA